MKASPERVAARWLQARIFQAPPAMVKVSVEWAQETYAAACWKDIQDRLDKGVVRPADADRLREIIKAAKRFAKRPATSSGPEAVDVPFDVRGWRYADRVKRLSRDELREAKREGGPLSDVMLIHAFQLRGSDMGSWNPNGRQIILWFPLATDELSDFLGYVEHIAVTVRHELQHAAQYSLGALERLQEPAGLPKHRQPGTTPGGLPVTREVGGEGDARVEHSLRDIEFHTRLQDEVDSWAAHVNAGIVPEDPEGVAAAVKVWVGAGRPSRLSGRIKHPTDFFAWLKREAPRKWRDAVGKFVREVFDDPMDFWKQVRSIR